LPALALYAKVAQKARKRGIDTSSLESTPELRDLLAVVETALDDGVDLEAALRRQVQQLADLVRGTEESSVTKPEAL